MSKNKKLYSCTSCGSVSPKWSGKCAECNAWGTVVEEFNTDAGIKLAKSGKVRELDNLEEGDSPASRLITPIEELNRVLGGGLVTGSAILIGGDPGIGKSTLLLQLASGLSTSGVKALYITGEESAEQIKLRARRLGIKENATALLAETSVENIIATIDKHKKNLSLVIIDSIQTAVTEEVPASPGSVAQVRASSHLLINYAKQNNITLILACHVNKDGQLAGPKLLEHSVDTVLYFEGDHNNRFRILRAIKNRYGSINEIGVFEMSSTGLVEISNPSELFLSERKGNVSGSAVFAGVEGSRPLLIEIQALIASSNTALPRRSVVGWDLNRLSMILAVLSVRFGLNLSSREVYLTVAGGLKITEPAADLAVAAGILSAATDIPLPQGSIFFGEIGLSGEVRRVSGTEARINEARKLGFDKAFCRIKDELNPLVRPLTHIRQLKELLNLPDR